MKHTQNLMMADVSTKKHMYRAIVDKYSGNKYVVIECQEKPELVGREYQYGHGLYNRKKIVD